MGLDATPELGNRSRPRPKTSHPSFRSCSVALEREIQKENHADRKHHLKSLDDDFRGLNLTNAPSPSRKSMPSTPVGLNVKDNEVLNRASMYQSSREVSRMRKLREGRRNVGPAHNDKVFLSFEIANSFSLPCQNEASLFPHQKRSPLVSLNAEDTKCLCTKTAPELVERGTVEERKPKCNQMHGPKYVDDINCERDRIQILPKSFSAKAGMFNSSCQSENAISKASAKSRFSPIWKMLDPIMKSKSQHNPSLTDPEVGVPNTDPAIARRNVAFRKSLLNDFSKVTEKTKYGKSSTGGRDRGSFPSSSPAHLHGTLKLENKNGVPSFEFSITDTEDVLSAMTWRTDNATNRVYTFHRWKRSNSTGWGAKDCNRQFSPMVGQMQVSCYLCSEVSKNRYLENSTVIEFILYDIAQARKSFSVDDRSIASMDPSDYDSDASTFDPWEPADLHPHLEIAAISIRIPFSTKKSFKGMLEDEIGEKEYPYVSSVSTRPNPANVKVVTPCGIHGLPSSEEGGPSSLLDRWRSGGGCDCGGWDMACPIVVFDNLSGGNAASSTTMETQWPMVLFVQGRKEKIPALSITADEKREYSVDFHTQLSALQAFSICIAILHSSEASSGVSQEKKNMQSLRSNSRKLLIKEEVRHSVEAVTEVEKWKPKKTVEHIPPSFILDPPFSPIGRV